jgi:hypothetical protein
MGLGSEIGDPRSGKNLFRIPDPGPGVKKAPDPGSATLIHIGFFIWPCIGVGFEPASDPIS